MKPSKTKSSKHGQSIRHMFAKQTAKRKAEELNDTKTKLPKLETLQDAEDDKENHSSSSSQVSNNPKRHVQKLQTTKCVYCCQKLNDEIKLYPGHPNNAVNEEIALTDPKLCLFSGDESFVHEDDNIPQNKLTNFSVYDKNGHLCPFDTDLIKKNVLLYFSGYLKPIYEEDPSPEGGVPAKDMGPINEWYVSGFDGGELALIGFSTAFAEYILMEPSDMYSPFVDVVKEKIYMSKLVIEFLLNEISPTYEDLLNKLQTVVPPKGMKKFTEDSLLRHAQFVCDQVLSFDNASETDEALLITNPCMRALASLAGVTLGKTAALRGTRTQQKAKKPRWTKATTTLLVNDMFENIFADQLVKRDEEIKMGPRRHRCGVCENCQLLDCGSCNACKDMVKFGGSGKSKQACVKRKCPNMAIQEADDSDPENEDQYEAIAMQQPESEDIKMKGFKELRKNIAWIGSPIAVDNQKIFYKSVMVEKEELHVNDYVLIEPRNSTTPSHIAKVIYMWETKSGMKQFHASFFHRGNDTILGETSDPAELFLSDDCSTVPIKSIRSKCSVICKKVPDDWSELGNTNVSFKDDTTVKADDKTFFYQLRYTPETARFEDPLPEPECIKKENSYKFCPACARLRTVEQFNTAKVYEKVETKSSGEVIYGAVKYRDEEYRVGTAVFLQPTVFQFKYKMHQDSQTSEKKFVDEDMYPEYYRKISDRVKGSNFDTPDPFCIGYINKIYACTDDLLVAPCDINIRVNKLYRPENTHRNSTLMEQADLNMVYWSEEVCVVKFTEVAGKCYLTYSENLLESVDEWSAAGPNRFYFNEAYNVEEKTFNEPPNHAIIIGEYGKGKGSSKVKGKRTEEKQKKAVNKPTDYKAIGRKLRTMDVFAGCGGLSEGFHQAGISENCWAIEKEEPTAFAYRLNNPEAIVFTEDCNVLLKKVMDGELKDGIGQKLPQKGEVELMCGGPPCQGFSGMNRFNSREPKFFVLENVRNFVSFKRSMVLKLTLRCLVRMGYQCTFGILQAGNYGVPQTRRRMVIMAAAPGETLPNYPEPTHVFSKRACQLNVLVDNKKYGSNYTCPKSAPFRTINVKDGMSDLPEIKNGWSKEEMAYNSEPMSHFQRKMRGKYDQLLLRDHICKEMAPLVEARMAHVPIARGSDWRDLPNIDLRLNDGTYSKKLEYIYHDKKAGTSSTGAYRGVCVCCTGEPCDPADRQFNTLIPWCLPHTGNRHNHWAGLYGRLEWDGFFSTTITNPEPMGKQGRVLHPTQTRVVSVRECARSQGFPDSYRFYGSILDKHRQVGNAVPPPLGAAIGHEIRKCIRVEKHESESHVGTRIKIESMESSSVSCTDLKV